MKPTSSAHPLAPVRWINAAGTRWGRRTARWPTLAAGELTKKAQQKTGLQDFGDPAFITGLEKLTEGLREEADLTQTGRFIAHQNLLDYLQVRLRLIDYRKRTPAVSRQSIKRPLFILGLPRTGTTILFELIAQDPANRSPASWEVARPVPPPVESHYTTDRRIRITDLHLSIAERLSPGFRAIHAIGARLPQECVYLFSSNFMSEQFGYMYHIPTYRRWLLEQPMAQTYRWHHDFLQHLQSGFGRERWILKTPSHLTFLDDLFERYPDAGVVWTHRDPTAATASFASLLCTLRRGFSDQANTRAVTDFETRQFETMLTKGMTQRDTLDKGQFLDVRFSDICRDPVAVVQAIYTHFDLELTPEAEQRMRQYLARTPRGVHGEHNYNELRNALDEDECAQRYAPYLARYGQFCR